MRTFSTSCRTFWASSTFPSAPSCSALASSFPISSFSSWTFSAYNVTPNNKLYGIMLSPEHTVKAHWMFHKKWKTWFIQVKIVHRILEAFFLTFAATSALISSWVSARRFLASSVLRSQSAMNDSRWSTACKREEKDSDIWPYRAGFLGGYFLQSTTTYYLKWLAQDCGHFVAVT